MCECAVDVSYDYKDIARPAKENDSVLRSSVRTDSYKPSVTRKASCARKKDYSKETGRWTL